MDTSKVDTSKVVYATKEDMHGGVEVEVGAIEDLVEQTVEAHARLVEKADGEVGVSVHDLAAGRCRIDCELNDGLPDNQTGDVDLPYGIDDLYEQACERRIAVLMDAALPAA